MNMLAERTAVFGAPVLFVTVFFLSALAPAGGRAAAALACIFGSFLYLYLRAPFESGAGIEISRQGVFIFVILSCAAALAGSGLKSPRVFLWLAAAFFVLIVPDPVISLVFLAAAELLAAKNRERTGNRVIYAVLAGFFLAVLVFTEPVYAKTAAAALFVFMLLASSAVDNTVSGAVKGPEPASAFYGGALLVFCAGIPAGFAGGELPYPAVMAIWAVICFAVLKSITEEKYSGFVVCDAANITLLSMAAAAAGAETLFWPVLALAGAGFLNAVFLSSGENSGISVTRIRYGFDSVKNGPAALTALVLTLSAEAYLFVVIAGAAVSSGLSAAVTALGALIYGAAFLNKLFMVFSMTARLNAGMVKAAFSGASGRAVMLLALFVLSLYTAGRML